MITKIKSVFNFLSNLLKNPIVEWLLTLLLFGVTIYLLVILYNVGSVIWWLYNLTKPN